MDRDKKYAISLILVTNAILISILESFIPMPIPLPGVKLGLANIITIIAINFLSLKDVLFIVILRCIVVAIFTKGIPVLMFSLTGGILSALVMWLLFKKLQNIFSIKGISIFGAIMHNTAQIFVASFLLHEMVIVYYLPILLISSVITGIITGSIAQKAIKEIKLRGILNETHFLNQN